MDLRISFFLSLALLVTSACPALAVRYVEFDTVLGDFYVELLDGEDEAPMTVDNFFNYSDSGAYDDSIVHRVDTSVTFNPSGELVYTPFVIQGGEAAFNENDELFSIPADDPVDNEPGISNTRGTLALARVGGEVDSGTNNWFINLSDNTFLDEVDEGFTVFGSVLGDGMEVVDAIASLQVLPLRSSDGQTIFSTVPFRGDLSEGVDRDNFVVINSITEVELATGDYNRDGVVDAADFTVWRDSLGSTSELAADGDESGTVDMGDFDTWSSQFGQTAMPLESTQIASSTVPEPAALSLAGWLLATYVLIRQGRRAGNLSNRP